LAHEIWQIQREGEWVNNNVIFLGLLVYLSVQYETDANPYSDEKIADKSKKE